MGRGRAGFSLLELIMVTVIVGIAAAVVTPRLTSYADSLTLETQARRVAAFLRSAQQQAITKETYYAAEADMTNRDKLKVYSYNAAWVYDSTLTLDKNVVIDSSVWDNSPNQPPLNSSNKAMIFDCFGNTSPLTNGGTVTLRHKTTSKLISVGVAQQNGKVSVQF